jgi:hypothetical protein
MTKVTAAGQHPPKETYIMSQQKKSPADKSDRKEPTLGNPAGDIPAQDSKGRTEPTIDLDKEIIGVTPANDDSRKEPTIGTGPVEIPAKDSQGRKEPTIGDAPIPAAAEGAQDERKEPTLGDAPAANAAPEASASENAATAEAPAAETDTATAAAAPAGISRKKKILSAVFNMAAGAAVTAVVKAAVVTAMAWTAAPAVATLLVSSLAVGAASTAFCHLAQTRAARKQGLEGPKFWTKQNAKTMTKSSLFALVGGALFLGFESGAIQNFLGFGHHAVTPTPTPVVPVQHVAPPVEHVAPAVTPPVAHVVAPVVDATPVAPVHCPTPMEDFNTLIQGHHVSPAVQEAVHRAASSNAHVAAQGTKDLAYYAQNGFDGVPKDTHVATELFKQAADSGNVQARVDLLYLQHHGLDGIAQNKAASLSAMSDIHTPKAEAFTKAWGGATKALQHVDFDSNKILQGVKLACPTP